MNQQELNKKLAEWAGFLPPICDADYHMRQPTKYKPCLEIPHFTDSLDACFKWLIPKLDGYTISYSPEKCAHEAIARSCNRYFNSWHETNPALALCLAIEKLIDGGN